MTCSDEPGGVGILSVSHLPSGVIRITGRGALPTIRVVGVGEIDLGSIVRQLLSSAPAGPLDLHSAHYDHDLLDHLPEQDRRKLAETTRYYRSLSFLQKAALYSGILEGKGEHSMESVIATMLRQETALPVTEKQILAYNYGTRKTIDRLLFQLLRRNEKVAIPLPNWHFWQMRGYEQKRYAHEYFDAHDEQEFVGNFAKVAARRDVTALMVVTPANPLMFTLSPDAAREIDQIALRDGVEIIVDDVLRGVRPLGDRHSIAEHFTRPYIVEGFSKRFGEVPFGRFSYVLLPEENRWRRLTGGSIPRIYSPVFGEMLHAAYQYSTEPAIEELRARNMAFDEGIHVHCPEAAIKRPSDSHIISLISLPDKFDGHARAFRYALFHQRGIAVGFADDFYPQGYPIPADKQGYLRVSVGKYSRDTVRDGAEAVGLAMKEYRG